LLDMGLGAVVQSPTVAAAMPCQPAIMDNGTSMAMAMLQPAVKHGIMQFWGFCPFGCLASPRGPAAPPQAMMGCCPAGCSAEGQAAVLAAGGAEAVVGALRAHVGVAAVQEWGCRAACNLAGSAEGKAAVLAVGGATAVVGALRSPEQSATREPAAAAPQRASSQQEDAWREAHEADVQLAEAVVEARQNAVINAEL
jgi:hypothetical protein